LGLRPKPHNCVELVGRPSRRLGRQCSPLAGTLIGKKEKKHIQL
jgi:hypothetical protein